MPIFNLFLYINAEDKIDGDVRVYIVDDGNLDLNVTGTYNLKLMCKDTSDNVTYKKIKVIVYENYNFKYFYEIFGVVACLPCKIFNSHRLVKVFKHIYD